VRIASRHGHHTGPDGVHPERMDRWELYRGRVPGRYDVYTGSTCHGWLQHTPEAGHTAHTPTGPTPIGLFRQVSRPVYGLEMQRQIDEAVERQGRGDLATLIAGRDTWTVE
jgi:hypothetical protein